MRANAHDHAGASALPDQKLYSTLAIHCVLSQTYPGNERVWRESLDLMSRLCGVNMLDESHNLIMADPRALSLAKAASEALETQLREAYPSANERSWALHSGKVGNLPIKTPRPVMH